MSPTYTHDGAEVTILRNCPRDAGRCYVKRTKDAVEYRVKKTELVEVPAVSQPKKDG